MANDLIVIVVGMDGLPLEVWVVKVLPFLEDRGVSAIAQALRDWKTSAAVFHFDADDRNKLADLIIKALEKIKESLSELILPPPGGFQQLLRAEITEKELLSRFMDRQDEEREKFFQYSSFRARSSSDRSRPRRTIL